MHLTVKLQARETKHNFASTDVPNLEIAIEDDDTDRPGRRSTWARLLLAIPR
jgi:hypothetical protein